MNKEKIEEQIDRTQKSLKKGYRSLVSAGGLIESALIRFIRDRNSVRANAIAYSMVIAIIPILTILIKFADVDRSSLYFQISRFLALYGISETSEIINILDDILSRANTIAGIGMIFMIYAATNILRHLDDSFNFIFRTKQRPFLYRFSLYISSLIFFPALIFLAIGGLRETLARFSPAEVQNFTMYDNRPDLRYVLLSNGNIFLQKNGETIRSIDLSAAIDFTASYRERVIDAEKKQIGPIYDLAADQAHFLALESRDFLNLKFIGARDDELFAVSESGVIFHSENRGRTWDYQIIGWKYTEGVRRAVISDFLLTESGEIYLITAGSTSALIANNRLHLLEDVYHSISQTHSGEIIIGGTGQYVRSFDDGRSWSRPIQSTFGNRRVRIKSVERTEHGLIFVGAEASLWIQADNENIFPSTEIRRGHLKNMEIQENGSGILYGDSGLIRYTVDHGRTWMKTNLDTTIHFRTHYFLPNGEILLGGSSETILHIKENNILRHNSPSGRDFVQFDVLEMQRFNIWMSVLSHGVFYIATFLSFLFIFSLLYRTLPNTRVQWKSAMIGGAVSATGLMIFAILFRTIFIRYSIQGYIYGVWLALPVGMIVILTGVQIILFGLEVTYLHQHPEQRRIGIKEILVRRKQNEKVGHGSD